MGNMKFSKNTNIEKVINEEKWKILIVDDEKDIHILTKKVLERFTYNEKGLEFISAYNGQDAITLLKENSDVALVLLDVIMESDDAGLLVSKRIREELKNHEIQIVLRTGEAVQSKEALVFQEYGINDYKEKTELSYDKLVGTLTKSIRAYENIKQ